MGLKGRVKELERNAVGKPVNRRRGCVVSVLWKVVPWGRFPKLFPCGVCCELDCVATQGMDNLGRRMVKLSHTPGNVAGATEKGKMIAGTVARSED